MLALVYRGRPEITRSIGLLRCLLQVRRDLYSGGICTKSLSCLIIERRRANLDALANLVTIVHLAYFVFVVGGFVGILAGLRHRKGWAYNPWFRIIHLLSVVIVLAEDLIGWN